MFNKHNIEYIYDITGYTNYQELMDNSLCTKQIINPDTHKSTNYYLTTCSNGTLKHWDNYYYKVYEYSNDLKQFERSFSMRDVPFTKEELISFITNHEHHQLNNNKSENQTVFQS